jgi:hypothetical protein
MVYAYFNGSAREKIPPGWNNLNYHPSSGIGRAKTGHL